MRFDSKILLSREGEIEIWTSLILLVCWNLSGDPSLDIFGQLTFPTEVPLNIPEQHIFFQFEITAGNICVPCDVIASYENGCIRFSAIWRTPFSSTFKRGKPELLWLECSLISSWNWSPCMFHLLALVLCTGAALLSYFLLQHILMSSRFPQG